MYGYPGEPSVTELHGGDGSVSDIPWASVFDPALNIRALGEIQARGFRAATEVVNRFIRTADTESIADPPDSTQATSPHSGADPQGDPASPAPDVERVLQLWRKLAAQVAESLRSAGGAHGGSATVDVQQAASSGTVSLVADEPGPVSTEVWLHNSGGEDFGKVRLRCSDLLAHDGALVKSALVSFEPDTVSMVARSSRGVTVEIDVPGDAGAGHYRGTLLADGHPDIWLPVVLRVLPWGS
jgi:hypothetical protein